MRILIPDIWAELTYTHEIASGLRNQGHDVRVASEEFWEGPGDRDCLLWLWPEGFFRHQLGGRLGLLTQKRCDAFFKVWEAWCEKALVVGVMHNFMPRWVQGNAGRLWITLHRRVVQESHGLAHLGQFSMDRWRQRFDVPQENKTKNLQINHGLFETVKAFQQAHQIVPLRRAKRKRVFVPGDLRTDSEVNMLVGAVERTRGEGIEWVIAGGDTFAARRKKNHWRLKQLGEQHNVQCYQRRLTAFELVAEIVASDALAVPRTRGLNSGIPFLAKTFERPVAMPDCGNMTEHAREVGGVLFEPETSGSDFAKATLSALFDSPNTATPPTPDWADLGQRLSAFFNSFR